MIAASYFDGHTTQRHPVKLLIHKGIVAMHGEGIRRSIKLSRLEVSERLEHVPRILRLPDGGLIECSDPGLARVLRKNGYREPRIVQWQRNWPLSLLALISVLALLISGYQWGLPWAADTIAQHLPMSVDKKIGDAGLELMDSSYLAPSRLPEAEQARLRQRFAELKQPGGERTDYRIEFRDSKIGPNAFALPNGVIVMTDQLVSLANNDHAVLGILGHELGHVHRRHSMRGLLQAASVGAVLNFLVGDVSSAIVMVPTFLLDQKYSRDFEREADQYAIDMMRANGIRLAPMAELFQKMASIRSTEEEDGRHRHEHDDDEDADAVEYLSSHPGYKERIAKLKAADTR